MSVLPVLAANGPLIFAGTIWLVILGVIIVASIFWLWMLVDCLMSTLPSTEKVVWILVIVFLHVVGALLYFFIGKRGGAMRAT